MDVQKKEHVELYKTAADQMSLSYFGPDATKFDKAGEYLSYPNIFDIKKEETLPAFEILSGLSKNVILNVTVYTTEERKEVSFFFSFYGTFQFHIVS